MGLEYIVHPQVFLGGLTALGPGIQGLTEQYPLLTTYNYWTSTASVDASAFPIPGTWSIYDNPNNSASFIVTVGGLVQTPDTYSINIINRRLTFNSIISAGIEIGATQLATAAPSSISYNYIESVNSVITNLTATSLTAIDGSIENLFVTNLTALSTTVNVIDIQYSEISGFDVTGNVNVFGNINVTDSLNLTGSFTANDINIATVQANNITTTNLTATDLSVINLTATNTNTTNSLVTSLTANNIATNNITVSGPISASSTILGLNIPTYYYLENNRSTIGNNTLTTTFFDTSASFALQPLKRYEMEYNLYYTKQTAGNLAFGLSTIGNLSQINAFYFQSPIAGIIPNGGTTGAGLISSAPGTLIPLPATGALQPATHYTRMLIQVENLNATTFAAVLCCSAGTITPLKGSYRKITLLP